jgi:hypothetical protein
MTVVTRQKGHKLSLHVIPLKRLICLRKRTDDDGMKHCYPRELTKDELFKQFDYFGKAFLHPRTRTLRHTLRLPLFTFRRQQNAKAVYEYLIIAETVPKCLRSIFSP